jgi:NHLM bacteriocin system ABC transporter ATP-binding protein
MIGSSTWERLSVPAVEPAGDRPIMLDDDGLVRFVESGSVALYVVPVEGGRIAGTRRFLARLGSGRALFACAPTKPDGLRFVFVPVEGTVLREASLETLARSSDQVPLGALLESWVALLADWLDGPRRPEVSVRATADELLQLDEDESFGGEPDQIVWAEVEQGRLHWFDDPERTLEPGRPACPVGRGLWARTAEPSRVRVRRTETLVGDPDLGVVLARTQAEVLAALERGRDRELASEVQRLRRRAEEQAHRHQGAVRDLAAILDPGARAEAGPVGGALLAALAEVGSSMGVTVRAPGKSEDLKRVRDPIDAIARASRIRTRRVVLSGKWWKSDCGPLLVYSGDDERRPLALTRVRGGYQVFDPVTGTRRRLGPSVAESFAREAVALYRPLPEGPLKLVDLLKLGLQGRADDVRLALMAGVIASVLGMVMPMAVALLMDQVIPDANRRLLVELGSALLAVTFGQVLFLLVQGVFLIRIHMGWEADTQAAVWDRVLSLRSSFFRRFSSGDLQSRVMAVNQIGKQLSGATMSSVVSGFMALLNLGLLLYYSPRLALIAVVIGVVVSAFTLTVSRAIRRNTRELLDLQGKLFGLEIQLINGVGKLRIAGAGVRAFNHWTAQYGRQLKLWARNFLLRDRVLLFNVILPPLSNLLLFTFAVSMLTDRGPGGEGLSLGTFLAFSAAYTLFLTGVTTLTSTGVTLMDVLMRGKRITPILEEEPEVNAHKADPGRLSGKLTVTDVHFRYKEDGPEILRGLDLRAEPGEFVAIVGPSGSGKSTLLRLLLGFETPSAGTVSYDDQELADVDIVAVRRQLGVVLQGGQLEAGTIFENIACGSVITLNDAWAAARDAGMEEDIKQMPMGMHTIISAGGGNISGGQRQRLLIARALGQRPRILLFDEATSALDNRTQAIVSESLGRLNVTRIVIAHRLSTIRDADRIYVVQDGCAVQEGSFESLMSETDGLFARMMQRQMT